MTGTERAPAFVPSHARAASPAHRTRIRSSRERVIAGAISALLLLIVPIGCSTSDDGGMGPGDDPAIDVSVNPSSATVEQGQSTMVGATITRSGGFSGAVSFSVTGAPAGVTSSVGNESTTGSTTTATITINVAGSVDPGQYALTVRGTGSGVSAASTTFDLTVTAAAGFTLALNPSSISIERGNSDEVAVSIERSGFSGPVTLALEGAGAAPVAGQGSDVALGAGLPTGVSATITPNPTTGNTALINITVAAGTVVTTHGLTLRATASGLDDRTAALNLTVTAQPANIPFEPTEVAVGGAHSCRLDADGDAACWGFDTQGQLGDDAAVANKAAPVAVAGGHKFSWIGAGGQYTCALDMSGQAWCWGADDRGQLGDGDPINVGSPTPVAVAGGLTFMSLHSAGSTNCALDMSGHAYCWGTDFYSNLGDGPPNADQTAPVPVSGGITFAALTVGGLHTCGLDTFGSAYCWGNDGYGELGDGAPVQNRNMPVPVAGGHTFVAIAAGDTQTCAADAQGQAYCWGGDFFGELGNGAGAPSTCGSFPCALEPVPVAGPYTFVALVGGGSHTCGLSAAGAAYCWGLDNPWGALGNDAALVDQITPVPVAGGHTFRELAAGPGNTCGVDTVGDTWCWGDDSADQLGDGPGFTKQPTPVKVLPLPTGPAGG